MKKGHHHVSIDYYAYISGMNHWNTTFKVLFSVVALVAVIAADSIGVSIVTVGFMLLLSVGKGKIRFRDYVHLLEVPAVFILLSGIAILIQFGSGAQAIWSVPLYATNMYISPKSLELALRTALKAFAAISALYMMTLSTPMGEILAVFRKIRVPEIILELMHLIYRYIFILSEINQKQKDAAASRLGYLGYKTSLRTFGSELANLFILSMKKSESYYDAMEARGYEGKCLFWEEEKKFSPEQLFWALFYITVFVCTAAVGRYR